MDIRRIFAGVGLATVTTLASGLIADPASATVTEYSGNTNPQGQNGAGQCAAGERWVYASRSPSAEYNPLGKTTDDLGADAKAPPAGNADAHADGVTLVINGLYASLSLDELVEPSKSITVGKVVVKSGNHFTTYSAGAAQSISAMSSPAAGATMAVNHAFVCYSVTAEPTPVVPEVPVVVLLPATAAVLGAAYLTLTRKVA